MLLGRYYLLAKYFVAGQLTYLEQMRTKPLIYAVIGYCRYCNELVPLQ